MKVLYINLFYVRYCLFEFEANLHTLRGYKIVINVNTIYLFIFLYIFDKQMRTEFLPLILSPFQIVLLIENSALTLKFRIFVWHRARQSYIGM